MFNRLLIFLLLLPCVLLAHTTDEWYALAQKYSQENDHAHAIVHYQKALALNPLHMRSWFCLGVEHLQQNQLHQAAYCFDRAVLIDPTCSQAHYNAGLIHEELGNAEEASSHYQQAVKHNHQHEKAKSRLAALSQKTEAPFTIAQYKDQIDASIRNGHYAHASDLLEQAYAIGNPNATQAFELACMATQLGMTDCAIAGFQRSYASNPHASTLYNIGFNQKLCGNLDTAISTFQSLLIDHPDYANAQFALSRAYLKKGDFIKGWQHTIPHFKESGKYAPELRSFLATHTLAGKRILLRPEGHFGDTIQFIRHAQQLKAQGAYVIAAIQPELIPLLSRCNFIDHLTAMGSPLPAHDASATLMSLPAILNVDETTIPKEVPYIYADPARTTYWRNTLPLKNTFNVGICWQASIHNDSSRPPIARRGIPLKLLAGLADIPNVKLFCLQKVDGLEEIDDMPAHFNMYRFDDTFDTTHGRFMDTAAVMQSMDLILTVDTAIAHLAGALGVPVFVMLPYDTDWRWLAHRSDSPWYPTMTLFQQPKPFDWETVAQKVTQKLILLAHDHAKIATQ